MAPTVGREHQGQAEQGRLLQQQLGSSGEARDAGRLQRQGVGRGS